MDRTDRWLALTVALGIGLTGVVALWFTLAPDTSPPVEAPAPPAPKPVPAPRPRPHSYRLAPPGESAPSAVVDAAAPGSLDPEHAREFQRHAMEAAGLASSRCLKPWADREGAAAEIVIDTVVQDGVVAEVQLRSLAELPEDVLDCVRDAAWQVAWPEVDAEGEVRFQRSITVEPTIPVE